MPRHSLRLLSYVLAFAFAVCGGPASLSADAAAGPGHQKAHGKGGGGKAPERVESGRPVRGPVTGHAERRGGRGEAGYAWSDRDRCRVVVNEYYGRHALPPGLAKKRSLPPGLRRQLRERGHLPPGLERYWVPLPVELERTLPPLPPHHVRRWVDDDLLVIDVRTNFVVSIMAGVFIRR